MRLESLELRQLLNVDWRNPVDSLDANGDGFIAPSDALAIINDINANKSRALLGIRPSSSPFIDPSGDQHVAPNDVLMIINAINAGLIGRRLLREGQQLASEQGITVTLGPDYGTRTYRVQLDASFDISDTTPAREDTLAVYIVDPNNPSRTLLDRGTAGTALFTLSGSKAEYAPGIARWDGSVLEINLSGVTDSDTGLLKFQMLNNDGDTGGSVTIKPLTSEFDPDGLATAAVSLPGQSTTAGASLNMASLQNAAGATALIENVRFDTSTKRFAADVHIHNAGPAIGRNAAVVFPGLPTGVTLANVSGTTAAGEPYINFRPAIGRGGLGTGEDSAFITVQFDDPSLVRFALKTQVLASVNHAPVLDPVGALSVMPGDILRVALRSSDSDGDTVNVSVDGLDRLPTGTLQSGGTLVFRPSPSQVGTYQFNVVASDGALAVSQPVTLNVVADPVTTTRVSGQVLQVNGQPLANMKVEIGGVSGLVRPDGTFVLDLGANAIVSDTIKIRGDLYNVGGMSYPFIAEKLPLLLEHSVYENVNNVIDRPIYLPTLNVAGGTAVDPVRDTSVKQTITPGETAEVFVAAGTLMNQQGTPFTGTLSITEVPTSLTPAALPEGLKPDLVVTIQPGEMVFARPAPLTLPNRSNYPPGMVLDLWSINPVTGQFDNVGKMQVSADGNSIETISGGIRNSSWHFTNPPGNTSPTRGRSYNTEDGCNSCPVDGPLTSSVNLHSGGLTETHDLVTYQSQGQSRGVQLVYNSLRADPRPILHFGIDEIDAENVFPFAVDSLRFAANLTVTRDAFSMTVPGQPIDPGPPSGLSALNSTPPPKQNYTGLPDDTNFWRLPAQPGPADGALQIDLRGQPSGVYHTELMSGVYFYRPGHDGEFNGASTLTEHEFVVVNSISSPFGAGWGITGWEQIVEAADHRDTGGSDRTALVVDSGGSQLLFKYDSQQQKFISPPGDFSTLEQLPDGTYRRTTTDHTVYQFNSRLQLATVTDRNHNITTYAYDGGGKLTSITDPVGLVTAFSYTGNRVSTITDPAGRQTKLEYDTAGNLLKVTDPDASTRTWTYDASHHMTGEIDQLGRTEQAVYGSHGRVVSAVRKDGSRVSVNAPEAQGLLTPEATQSWQNAPRMSSLPEQALSTYVDGNGNVHRTQLDDRGQALNSSDGVGRLPSVKRDANSLPTEVYSARGNASLSTYDSRGNLLTTRDSLSARIGDQAGTIGLLSGQIKYYGEVDHYTFEGKQGELIWVDSLVGSNYAQLYRVADHTGVNLFSGGLPTDGAYQADVTGPPDNYVIRLLDPKSSPPLSVGVSVTEQAPVGQDFVYRVTLSRGQSLHVVDQSPDSHAFWQIFSFAGSYVYFNQGSSQGLPTYDFVAPADGEYYVVVDRAANADLTNVPFTFTPTVTTVPPQIVKSGLDATYSGTLAPGQKLNIPISAPAGTAVYIDLLSGQLTTYVGVEIETLSGQPVMQAGYNGGSGFLFTQAASYNLALINNAGSSASGYAVRVVDLTAAPVLAVGDSFTESLKGGQAKAYRLSGKAGQRVVAGAVPELSSLTLLATAQSLDGSLPRSIVGNSVLTLPETGEEFLVIDTIGDNDTFTWQSFDARAAQAIPLDQMVAGQLTATDRRKTYRFSSSDQLVYFEKLLATPATRATIFSEQSTGQPLTQSQNVALSNGGTDGLSHEYFLTVSPAASTVFPQNFAFELHAEHRTSADILIGQTVSGRLDWTETDTYTFTGTAGQTLYYDARSYDAAVDTAVSITISKSGSSYLYSAFGRNADSAPFQLPEAGEYTIEVKSEPGFDPNAILHRDYSFRLVDAGAATIATLNQPFSSTLASGSSAAVYRFAGAAGQRVTFAQANPATTSLRVYTPQGKLLADSLTGRSLTTTFGQTGTYYLVVVARDLGQAGAVTAQWTITSAEEPSVAKSGYDVLYEGQATQGQVLATFSGNAGAQILFQQDNSYSSYYYSTMRVLGPANEEVGTVGIGGPSFLILPRSGTYTVQLFLTDTNFTTSPYHFLLRDVTDLPVIDPNGTATVPAASAFHAGTPFQIQGIPGDQVWLDLIQPDTYNDSQEQFFPFRPGLYAYGFDPSRAQGSSPEYSVNTTQPMTIPASGRIVVMAMSEVSSDSLLRVQKLKTVPTLQQGDSSSGTLPRVHDDVLYRFSANANEKRLFQLDSPNWYIYNLATREQVATSFLQPMVVTFPATGDYLLVRKGRLGDLKDYSAVMASFTDDVTPLTNGVLSRTEYTYESTFNRRTSGLDDQGNKTLYDIDPANGNVRAMTQVMGQLGGGDDLVTLYTYLASGQVDTLTDPLGRITDYDYDTKGRLIKITSAKGTALEATQQFEYDAAGNPTAVIDAKGARTSIEYDNMNRRTRITQPGAGGASTAPITRFLYDAVGNLVTTTDPAGHDVTNTYDALDRVLTTTDGDNQVTKFAYDQAGNLIRVTDPLGLVAQRRYDARNRLVSDIDSAGVKTQYAYDLDDNLISVTDGVANVTRYTYDARNRRTSRIDSLGHVTTYLYDGANEIVAVIDRLGRKTTFSYDGAGRISKEEWLNSDGSVANTITYAYDAAGQLLSATDQGSTVQYSWDALGRATQIVTGGAAVPGATLHYTFDAVGNVLSLADTVSGQAGGTMAYTYDALDRVTQIVQTGASVGGKRVSFEYNALGQMTSLSRFSDSAGQNPVATSTYGYDAINRLSSIVHKKASAAGILTSFDFQYDAASRLTQITDIDGATTYSYDARGELTSATHSDSANPTETYGYDATGNRTSASTGSALHNYQTGSGNRVQSDGTYSYTYDKEGNLTERKAIASAAVRSFSYDHRNRLVQVIDRPAVGGTPTQVVKYTYNLLDRRIAKNVDSTPADAQDGVTTYFVYDGEDVLLELTDSDGTGPAPAVTSMRYLHGPAVDQALAQDDLQGGVEWMLTDHLGTVHDLVNNAGHVDNHIKYDSYGNVIAQSNASVHSRYAFTGREFDSETSLQYNRARYYDAATGRFLSEDPIGLVAGPNLYAYVGNRPSSATDPSGLIADPGAGKKLPGVQAVYDVLKWVEDKLRRTPGADTTDGDIVDPNDDSSQSGNASGQCDQPSFKQQRHYRALEALKKRYEKDIALIDKQYIPRGKAFLTWSNMFMHPITYWQVRGALPQLANKSVVLKNKLRRLRSESMFNQTLTNDGLEIRARRNYISMGYLYQ